MRILKSEPSSTFRDERFSLSLQKNTNNIHKYQLYFSNNSNDTIPKLQVKREELSFNSVMEATFVNAESTIVIENIKSLEKVFISEVDEYDNKVDDFYFVFSIPYELETISFTYIINRRELLPNLTGPAKIYGSSEFENLIPDVIYTPIKYNGGNIFSEAIKVAAEAHKHQLRKGTSIPYIFHPMETARILADCDCTEEILAAAVLHDTLEDTEISPEYIEKMFGKEILQVVLGASEPDKDKVGITWGDRKKHTLDYLAIEASKPVMLVACADKLSNIRSIYQDYQVVGDKLWSRFKAGYEQQKWYYQNLLHSLKGISGFRMYDEFHSLVRKVFGKFTPNIKVTGNLKTIDRELDLGNILICSSRVSITRDLACLIREFNLQSLEGLDDGAKKIMQDIENSSDAYFPKKQEKITDENWINVVRILYILKPFLYEYSYLTKLYVEEDFFQWFIYFEED